MGLDFRDTIIVRRTVHKGTKVVEEPLGKSTFYDKGFDEQEEKRLKLAGDLMIMSAKGTKKIRLSDMDRTKPTLPKGMSISTSKGTSKRKLD
jgi:hypothetical protein